MIDTFRYFIRKCWPEVGQELSNDDIDELGLEFKTHLEETLTEKLLEEILPKNPMDIIMNADHPFKTNGFHPAYVIHFTQFIEKLKQEHK